MYHHKLTIKLMALIFCLYLVPSIFAGEGTNPKTVSWETRNYIIEGVYYLINEGDLDTAEELFRKAVLSSSFDSLSKESKDQNDDRYYVAEAFYFLGKIYYEKAMLDVGNEIQSDPTEVGDPTYKETDSHRLLSHAENIAWARKYLEEAQEYGLVHDRLHPPLLDEINRKYPKVKTPTSETSLYRAKIIIESENCGSYQVNGVKVDQHTNIDDSKFSTNKEVDLDCGARYKIMLDIQRGYESVYRALIVLSIGIVIWLTRS